ncbi:NAD(P)-binding domain-containing protein [Sutcliffiella cohnii]
MENDFPTKEDMATYLENYVNHFELPVKGNTEVKKLRKQDSVFHIETNNGVLRCKQVIVATGAFQKPYIPVVSNSENQPLYQLHSSQYRSPKNIPGNSVLVVGGGNSGAQIAVELSKEKNVTIAIGHPFKFLPLHLFGKSIFSLLDKLGLLYGALIHGKGNGFKSRVIRYLGKN